MRTEEQATIDKYVGARIRARRVMFSMSQSVLAEQLGLTFQQVQKYEKGANRVGASRLQHIAEILKVPVSFFFEGAPRLPRAKRSTSESNAPSFNLVDQFLATPEGMSLVKAFSAIKSANLRRGIVRLAEQIARGG
jgi:transcriptional regulator with XRE-family HTH domain